MDDAEAGRYWECNAEVWTSLSRAGWDVYRDSFNTPAFLALLPDVRGLVGLDIGCGEGHNTRLVAFRAARMYAIDIAPTFLRHALEAERRQQGTTDFAVASAFRLPFQSSTFDFATAFMSLMDLPSPEPALAEAFRVLKPRGFLQFSIIHPCFFAPHRRLLRDANGNAYAVEVGRYFDQSGPPHIEQWLFSAAPPDAKAGLRPFQVPVFHRPLSGWLNAVIDAGFRLERVAEPFPDDDAIQRYPSVADSRVVAYYLHLRCRKP